MGLSYKDAVLLLTGRRTAARAALDKLAGGLLLAASPVGGSLVLSLFDAKGELASLSGDLVSKFNERYRKLDRVSRTERVVAAHSVIVMTAFFGSLPSLGEFTPTATEQARLAGASPELGESAVGELARALLETPIPTPTPEMSLSSLRADLEVFYNQLSHRLILFLDGIDRPRGFEFHTHLAIRQALANYDYLSRQLASEVPEFRFWVENLNHSSTQATLDEVKKGLAGLGTQLEQLASRRSVEEGRLGLQRAYRADLDRPLLAANDAPEGITLPSLSEGYINPAFKVVESAQGQVIASESGWKEVETRHDIESFMLAFLTSQHSTNSPLLILGQPGSGKSVLSRVLSAQLPAADFLVVRVALRDVPADLDLQGQIERTVRAASGEFVHWPELVRSSGGALPVVILDGFDELLQATGVSQTDYLEKVAYFQQRESDNGRPVVVMVTSRTAVMDRARIVPGTMALRLEPFTQHHVEAWLAVWNRANEAYFQDNDLRPLQLTMAIKHPHLASQPLLLTMIALYDLDGNVFQAHGSEVSEAELYERLLHNFAIREVRKSGESLTLEQLTSLAESDLFMLSLIAFSMFNRGRQWVTDSEITADFSALAPETLAPRSSAAGLALNLTAGQLAVGRFFFVHEARALRDDTRTSSFEFLHATFGEFLIARLIVAELAQSANVAALRVAAPRRIALEDSFLYSLLSFAPLTLRASAVLFLEELLGRLPTSLKAGLAALVLDAFKGSLNERRDAKYEGYSPLPKPVTARCAIYSSNLVLLLLLVDGEVSASRLFPEALDYTLAWRNIALLWKSQIPYDGWNSLSASLAVQRVREADRRDVVVALRHGKDVSWSVDPRWIYDLPPEDTVEAPPSWSKDNQSETALQAEILVDRRLDLVVHAIAPMGATIGASLMTFARAGDQTISAANALITLYLTSTLSLTSGRSRSHAEIILKQDYQNESRSYPSVELLKQAYSICFGFMEQSGLWPDLRAHSKFAELVLRKFMVDMYMLPIGWIDEHVARWSGRSSAFGPEATILIRTIAEAHRIRTVRPRA